MTLFWRRRTRRGRGKGRCAESSRAPRQAAAKARRKIVGDNVKTMAKGVRIRPLREPKAQDIAALPASVTIRSSAGAVEIRVDRRRLFALFVGHFDRLLATGPKHANFEQTVASEIRRKVRRDEALRLIESRHRAAVRMYAFHALREFISNPDHAEELFKSWFEVAMGHTHAELRNTPMMSDSGDLFAFLDHEEAEIRSRLLNRSIRRLRKIWKAPVGGDRRSKLHGEVVEQFVELVRDSRELWSLIKPNVERSAVREADAIAIASSIATENRVHASHLPIISVVAPLLVRRGITKPNRAPQALAALHAAIALNEEQLDFHSRDDGRTAPSRWNRIYQRQLNGTDVDDDQPFT
jgi:hypothetical protein